MTRRRTHLLGHCTKKGYRDHKEAIKALHSCVAQRSLGASRRHEVRAYQCPRCGRWHLTSWTDRLSIGGVPVTAT